MATRQLAPQTLERLTTVTTDLAQRHVSGYADKVGRYGELLQREALTALLHAAQEALKVHTDNHRVVKPAPCKWARN